MIFRAFLLLLLFFSSGLAFSQVEHHLLRKLTVFPVNTPKNLRAAGEESWWQVREALTESKRFLVASKSFMMQKDVFQPRGDLSPADAIILGKLLDADAIMVTFIEDRKLRMKVFEGEYGRILWEHEFQLQPSLPMATQLPVASKRLVQDFLASVPYQGFVVRDNLKSGVVFEEQGKKYIHADVGLGSGLEVGDSVQLIRLNSDSLKPLFGQDITTEVFAEGIVEKIDREIITARLTRVADLKDIQEKSLLRAPKELQRLKKLYALQQGELKIGQEVLADGMSRIDNTEEEQKPLAASLSFIGNLALFLLLAF